MAALGWTSPMYHDVIDASHVRYVLARDQREGAAGQDQGAGVLGRRLVRQFRAERSGGVSPRCTRRQRPEPHSDRAVAAQHVVPVRGVDFGPDSSRADPRAANGMVRPVADGQGLAAAVPAAGEDLRDGRQQVARGAGVAARAGARPRLLYLESGGRANSLDGDGALAEQRPRRTRPTSSCSIRDNPVPTRGGAVCCNPKIFPWGPMDQRRWNSARTCWSTPPSR